MLATPDEIAAWPAGSDGFVEAFAKGLAVIGAFGPDGGTRSLADLARRTGLPRAGVRRLVLTLVALGLAEARDGRFALTPRVLRLGFAYLSTLGLREVAQPLIETLSREADEVVAVSVLDGDDLVYVARAEVQGVLRRSLTVGSRLPAFCTSMGRVLLSGLPDDEVTARLSRASLPAHTRHTVTDPATLTAVIAEIRRTGWTMVSEELEIGACGMAAAIRDGRGHVVAAVNISTNLARHTQEAFVRTFRARLLATAEEISRRLPPG
ncbi:IclR family transcriptional regulator domain-containing protein [Rhodoplanes roseus]|uniref:PcaR/PcaU/PobR family beta-ketoadipate pathway transcriptional regulator n=1 Tax=Rhodoplanes roseus TaxID=29409 RepID=A0A327KHW4_9BRAD|nr:IclR family transcriptional regulator C-terminal domain-containing protein [Rhodoplanes roseus]RAI38310.1 PcaR/PcaU/PobR family beta-ketoadipate pathway transcriptional regulator [Rhodoplanes roseus]